MHNNTINTIDQAAKISTLRWYNLCKHDSVVWVVSVWKLVERRCYINDTHEEYIWVVLRTVSPSRFLREIYIQERSKYLVTWKSMIKSKLELVKNYECYESIRNLWCIKAWWQNATLYKWKEKPCILLNFCILDKMFTYIIRCA